MLSGSAREPLPPLVRRPELHAVPVGLLEVVAEDLVQLDEIRAVSFEPRGEALVKLGARRLRQRVIRRVADQQVQEAERILARELRLVGPHELLAHQRAEAGHRLELLRGESLHSPAMEDSAFDGTPLEHAALGGVQLVEARRQQRLDRRWNRHVAVVRLHDERHHLLNEQRVAFRRLADALTKSVVEVRQARDHQLRLVGAERLQQNAGCVHLAARPARPTIE